MKTNQPAPTTMTPESIPAETRTALKNLYADPDPGRWYWDRGTWRWELSLRDVAEDVDADYVYIAPHQDGKPLKYGTVPEPDHREWALGFFLLEELYVAGTLQEAKAVLDNLLREPTPEIPPYVPSSWP